MSLILTEESNMGVKERREREEQARLAAILTAAETVFASKGYYQARMEDVAKAAELAKGTIYYYFKSKDEIYARLIEREAEKASGEIRRCLSDENSFLVTVEKILAFYVEYFHKNPAFLKIHFQSPGLRPIRGTDLHKKYISDVLRAKLARENLSLPLDDLMKFLRTLQIGIGFRLLEGNLEEAQHAARFFLDLLKRTMEKNR
jgi:AcrR family transcriptional regulator